MGAALVIGIPGLLLQDEVESAVRFGKSAYCVAETMLDHRTLQKDEFNARLARRLLNLCEAQGGMYIKCGQYVATMNHVLPRVYGEELSRLQDKAPFCPWEDIEEVLEEENILQNFDTIDKEPIAAASLAQLHRAVLDTGEEVAVKIQRKGLKTMVKRDLLAVSVLMNVVGFLYPEFEFSWILPEFQRTIEEELDFEQERRI